ncbi:hypothetical protein ACLB2K_077404 [Fragaria x ananassa]
MLTHNVGHIIRDEISMVAATWGDTTEDEQKKLPTKLFIFYEFDVDDNLMWKWLDDKAKNAYKNRKCTINTIRKENLGKILEEFEHWLDEWNWLLKHFESNGFTRRSAANKSNRDKKTLHHHTGAWPFIYNAKELKDKGEYLYFIKSYSQAYNSAHNQKAAENEISRLYLALKLLPAYCITSCF